MKQKSNFSLSAFLLLIDEIQQEIDDYLLNNETMLIIFISFLLL